MESSISFIIPHHSFNYQPGLHIDIALSEKNGPNFTFVRNVTNIPDFYSFGFDLIEVHPMTDDPNIVILGEKYPLCARSTHEKFSLEFPNKKLLFQIAVLGYVDILKDFRESDFKSDIFNDFLDKAYVMGNLNVIEWWLNSGIELPYSEEMCNYVISQGRIDILDLFIKSGIELKYSTKEVNSACKTNPKMAQWWRQSDLID